MNIKILIFKNYADKILQQLYFLLAFMLIEDQTPNLKELA